MTEVNSENTNAGMQEHQAAGAGNPAPKQPQAVDPKVAEQKVAEEEKAAEAVAKEEEEPKPEENQEEKNDPLDTNVWGDSGSEAGNAVLEILQNSGATIGEAKELLWDAVAAGKPEDVDQAALEAKFGKTKAFLIMTGVKAYVKESTEKAQAIVADLHQTVGGKDHWDTIAAWAKNTVDQQELDTLREMIDAGGVKARLAAKELRDRYNADENNSQLDSQQVIPTGGAPVPEKVAPLSAAQYATKLDALYRAHNGAPPDSARRALLNARNAGKAKGL